MATNVKILLRRGKRAELNSGDTLSGGELGYTTDTNQLYIGLVEPAVNEIQFDPFTNAHATIQTWLDSSDCPVPNLTVDEDLIIADIPAGEIDNIMNALNTYSQSVVFNTDVATFNEGELLTQYKKIATELQSPNLIPNINSITSIFTVEGETISVSGVTSSSLVSTLQANAAISAANVIVSSNTDVSRIIFTKIDGKELNITFPTAGDAHALGFTQSVLEVNAGAFVTGTDYTISTLGTDTLVTNLATALVSGREYKILTVGDTDFTTVGSSNNNVGTIFTATGVGTGTGTVTTFETFTAQTLVEGEEYRILVPGTTDFTALGAADSVVGTVFTKNSTTGLGDGTANSTSDEVATTVQANWEAAGAPPVTAAGSFVVGKQYSIVSLGTTIFTYFAEPITSGSFIVGREYTIATAGTTNFTLIGAADSNVGTVFTATGVGTGTGTAKRNSWSVGETFTATNVGIQEVGAGDFTIGRQYTISTVGDTDFTTIGSLNSNVGTIFTASGVGSGTGFANYQGTGVATSVIVGTTFTATGAGQGNGIATYDNGNNTVAEITGYNVYANGKIKTATQAGGNTTVVVEVSENSDYFNYQQEGVTSKPYSNAPDNSPYFHFGTPSTPNYATLDPSVESTSVTGSLTDTKIGLFGHKRLHVEVLTEESRNQLFANQHLKSYASSTGLRSDLYKKTLPVTQATINATAIVEGKQYQIVTAGTTDFTLNGAADSNVGTKFFANSVTPLGTGTVEQLGTFLKYPKLDCTSFFIDYSLKQTDGTNTFVRVGTLRVINGVPQGIQKTSITDENTEVWDDLNSDSVQDANEFSNIAFNVGLQGNDLEINYTQSDTFTTEISYTVKRWTM
jgi:hypothetical protein